MWLSPDWLWRVDIVGGVAGDEAPLDVLLHGRMDDGVDILHAPWRQLLQSLSIELGQQGPLSLLMGQLASLGRTWRRMIAA